jgi:malonate transporter
MMMVTYVVWYLYQRLGRKQDSGESALQSLAVGQPNFAAAGFPVITALVGPGHLSTVALAIAAGSLLPSPVTLALLELDQRRSASKSDTKDTSKSSGTRTAMAAVHALSKPIVLAPVFGLFVSWIGWSIPQVIETSLQEIGSAAGGMALFVTGLVLSHGIPPHAKHTAGRRRGQCRQPLLTFALCIGIGADVEITKLSVVMAALPSGFFGVLFGTSYGRPSSEANSTIIASTIFSAITLAVAIAWTYSYRE